MFNGFVDLQPVSMNTPIEQINTGQESLVHPTCTAAQMIVYARIYSTKKGFSHVSLYQFAQSCANWYAILQHLVPPSEFTVPIIFSDTKNLYMIYQVRCQFFRKKGFNDYRILENHTLDRVPNHFSHARSCSNDSAYEAVS